MIEIDKEFDAFLKALQETEIKMMPKQFLKYLVFSTKRSISRNGLHICSVRIRSAASS